MPETTFKELFEKFLQDNMTPEEVRTFQAMANDRRNKQVLERLLRDAYQRILPIKSAFPASEEAEMNALFTEVMLKVNREEARKPPVYTARVVRLYRRYGKAAGRVAAVLCIGYIGIISLHKYIAGAASDGMTIHASIGVRKSLTLADGSKVLLNAGSTLTLADGFGITGRQVTLSGEAYFEVAKNARIPFLVHTTSMDIRVMGTSFNVRSYPDEPRDITSLISGRISVTIRNEGEKTRAKNYYLEPLQKITVNKDGTTIALPGGNSAGSPGKDDLAIDSLRVSRLVDQIPETAWTENKLFFDAEPLDVVMERIERWYGVKVRLDNDAIANLHFTGSYRNESLKEVMEALELSNPEIHYRMENNDKLLILF